MTYSQIFNNDIYGLIISSSDICNLTNLSSVNTNFHKMCVALIKDTFREKELTIINNNIVTYNDFLDEYKKVSLATYNTTCIINLIKIECKTNHKNTCSRVSGIDFNNNIFLPFIFSPTVLNKININSTNKIHITMLMDWENSMKNIRYFVDNILITKEKCIHSEMINKIFYYYPNILITDVDYHQFIIHKNGKMIGEQYNELRINNRKLYWEECHDKYESLYF